jgi:hypothetical protein
MTFFVEYFSSEGFSFLEQVNCSPQVKKESDTDVTGRVEGSDGEIRAPGEAVE